ncbi:MAG TPA: CYTH and CHAD domain-containing protein [Actinotalea sp.]|nr:CYTH and CHAD domain-containing protein [Actinotalea sp.]
MAARTAVETETTVDVGPGWTMPDVAALVPRVAAAVPVGVRRLAATYLDTADLALLRGRVTLRRRTGGPDAGWHLKLPLPDARLEVRHEAPRPPSDPPVALTDLVRARTRGAPLGPVAVLRTTRTVTHLLDPSGVVLAEVVDDRVVARRPGDPRPPRRWREVEVELVAGDRHLLDAVVDVLLTHGARPAASQSKLARALADGPAPAAPSGPPRTWATAGDVVLAYLAAQVEEVVGRDPQVRLDLPDAVHRMRVAARRLRSTLDTYRRLLDADVVRHLRSELRWWGTVLGAARDAEVLRERLIGELGDLPRAHGSGPAADRLRAELDRGLEEARAALLDALGGRRYLTLLEDLGSLVARPAWTDRAARPPATLNRAVRRTVRRVRRTLRSAGGTPEGAALDTALHEARKAAKAARYAAESVTGLVGEPAERLAERMTGLQDLLGEHQDGLVVRARLSGLAAGAGRGEPMTGTLEALAVLERGRHRDGAVVLAEARALTPERWAG